MIPLLLFRSIFGLNQIAFFSLMLSCVYCGVFCARFHWIKHLCQNFSFNQCFLFVSKLFGNNFKNTIMGWTSDLLMFSHHFVPKNDLHDYFLIFFTHFCSSSISLQYCAYVYIFWDIYSYLPSCSMCFFSLHAYKSLKQIMLKVLRWAHFWLVLANVQIQDDLNLTVIHFVEWFFGNSNDKNCFSFFVCVRKLKIS